VSVARLLVPANSRRHAAVLDRWQDERALHRPVGEVVDPIGEQGPNAGRDVVSAPDDDVGPESAHELLVRLGGIGNHGEPCVLRELDDVATEGASRTGDGE
jgi:hypothetical protein